MRASTIVLIAGALGAAALASAQDLLDPEVAFKATAALVKPGLIEVRYVTAPGYYLYRDRLAFNLEPAGAKLGKPRLPPGKIKRDKFFGKQVIYRNLTVVTLPLPSAPTDTPLTLVADLQGCADLGVCYPPVRRKLSLSSAAQPAQ